MLGDEGQIGKAGNDLVDEVTTLEQAKDLS
jgi:hypothetical protein